MYAYQYPWENSCEKSLEASNIACPVCSWPRNADSTIVLNISPLFVGWGSSHPRATSADCTNTAPEALAEVSTTTSRRTGGMPAIEVSVETAFWLVSFLATSSPPCGLRAARDIATPTKAPQVIC